MPFSSLNAVSGAHVAPELRIQQLQKKYGDKLRGRPDQDHALHKQQSANDGNHNGVRPNEAFIKSRIVDPRVNYRVRLFISSTFRDMLDERDELVKRVLPKVHKFCDEHRIQFSYVDLRWGITTEETNSGRTIQLCLDSIDQCRPYFMCLLGDRYGWSQDKNEADALLCKTFDIASKSHPWLQGYRDRSVTELEVLYSSLFYPHLAPHSLFYFRKKPKPAIDEDAAAKKKLESLKARIAAAHAVKYYDDLSSLGNQVYADFCAAIIADFQLHIGSSDGSSEDAKQAQQEDAMHRYQASINAQLYLDSTAHTYFPRLDAFVQGPGGKIALVHGLGGCGKTALLSAWAEQHFTGRDFVVTHLVGACDASDVHTNIMARITRILDEHFNLLTNLDGEGSVEDKFKTVLAAAGNKAGLHKIVLVIDGLDQLVPSSKAARLTWLPYSLPSSVYVVASANTMTDAHKICTDRGCVAINIAPLSLEEQHDLVEKYLSKYSKRLTSSQTRLVTGDGKTASNPMFLTTLLAELRLTSSFENLEQDISHYTGAKFTQQLYGLIFARWEADQGARVIDELLSVLYCARQGLAAEELLTVLRLAGIPMSPVAWQNVLTTVAGSSFSAITQQNGVLRMGNKRVKKAIREKYLKKEEKIQAKHELLIKLFEQKSAFLTEDRRCVELAFSLFKAQKIETLYDLLSSPDTGFILFDQLCTGDRFDLLRYWRRCEPDPLRVETVYMNLMELHERTSDKQRWSEILQRLGFYLEGLTCYEGAGRVWEQKLKLDRSLYGTDDDRLAVSLLGLALCCEKREQLEEAEQAAQQALRLRVKKFGETHPQTVQVLMTVATLAKRRGHYKQADNIYKSLLGNIEEIYGAGYTHHPDYARILEGQGDVYRKEARFSEALDLYTKANVINAEFYGESAPSFSRNLKNIALIHKKQGNLSTAEALYRRCLAITLSLCGEKHADTGRVINELADVLRKNGNLDAAEGMYKRSLAITQTLLGENHIDVVQTIMDLALILKKRGLYPEAQASYEKCLGIVEATLGKTHYKYAELLNQLGDVHRKLSRYDMALALYREALSINKAALGLKHIEVGETLNNIGLVLKKNGQYDEAESCFSQAIEIAERDGGDSNYKVGAFLNNLADVYRKRGKFHQATADYIRAIRITETTLGPSNVELAEPLLGLATANKKLGLYAESEPLLIRAAGIIFLNFNIKHPKMALILHSLADIHRKGVTQLELQCLAAQEQTSNLKHELPNLQRRVVELRAKAKMLYERALKINEVALGSGDIEVAENLKCLASLLKQADSRSALSYMERAVNIVKTKLGDKHAKFAEFVGEQGEVVLAAGKAAEAKQLYQRALTINISQFGERHPEVAHCSHGVGLCLLAEGKAKEALPMLIQAAKLTEATLGSLHLSLALRLLSVSNAYKAVGDSHEAQETRQTVFRNFGSATVEEQEGFSWVYSQDWNDENSAFSKSATLRVPPANASQAVIRSLGRGFTTVQASVLTACAQHVPNRDPVTSREWRVVNSKGGAKDSEHSLTVMQFNMLAEGLSSGPEACPPFPAQKLGNYGGFDAVPNPSEVFRFADRRMRLLAEILSVEPDLLGLEEVDHFEDWFAPALDAAGYAGVFCPKFSSPCLEFGYYSDGAALFWKKSVFSLLISQQRQTVEQEVEGVEEKRNSKPLKVPHVLAVLTHLKSSWPIAVAVTHLKSKKGAELEAMRSRQISGVLKGLSSLATEHNCAHSMLMGDFNTSPLDEKDYKASTVRTVENWQAPQFASAYLLPTKKSDPQYTTWKKRGDTEAKQVIDYIFVSPNFRPTQTLSPPHSSDLDPSRLPGLKYPSDHLAIAAQMTLLHP